MNKKEVSVSLLLIVLILLARLMPHVPNVAPTAAAALVAGVYLGRKWALIVPVAGMFLSDLVVGFYNPWIMMSVYGSFVLVGFISWFLKNNKNFLNIVTASLVSSLLFFLITNFAVWAASDWYSRDLFGLLYSYELAVPFFRNTIIGDFVYTTFLFVGFEFLWARKEVNLRIPVLINKLKYSFKK